MRRFLLQLAAAAVLLPAGCGYHTLGSAAHLPPAVHTLAVPIFKNQTQFYHTEIPMTQAVVRELTSRTHLAVEPGGGANTADATLTGVILSEDIQPLTYNSRTQQTSSFLVTIHADVTLTDRDHRVLYRHTNYIFHQQFETTSDFASFLEEDSPAVERLSRDFAQTLVSDILESF